VADQLNEITTWFMAVAPRFALLLVRKHGVDYETAREALQQSIVRIIDRQRTDRNIEREGTERDRRVLSPPLRFDNQAHFEKYLWTSSSYLALDERRRHHRMADETALTLLATTGFSTDDELIRQERLQRLREAIEHLDERYRVVFKLLAEEELPMRKVAAKLGIKPASAYKRYERGLEKLREILGRS
jgi:RNA polymerase sigma factor (sigma-70 family)